MKRSHAWESCRECGSLPFMAAAGVVLATGLIVALHVSHAQSPLGLAVAVVAGYLLGPVVQPHPTRALGLVVWLGLVWLAALLPGPVDPPWRGMTLALASGAQVGLLLAVARHRSGLPLTAAAWAWSLAWLLVPLNLCWGGFGVYRDEMIPQSGLWLALAPLAVFWLHAACISFRREVLESLVELLFLFMYRFRTFGPVELIPPRGPLLIVANHAAFLDPLWIGKIVPRRLTPLMTSVYYDLPILRFLMVHIIRAIRVADVARRKEAPPEIAESIARLDAGECLLVFPEARLRRDEATLLRYFGQGLWHILKERPQTPVIPIWIEGGWGSFFSHYNNQPPLRGKPFDWFRPIQLAVGKPEPVPAEQLSQHQTTRRYLMDRVLAVRVQIPNLTVALTADIPPTDLPHDRPVG